MKFLATLALAFALANTGNAGHVNLPLVDLMSHARFTDFKAILAGIVLSAFRWTCGRLGGALRPGRRANAPIRWSRSRGRER